MNLQYISRVLGSREALVASSNNRKLRLHTERERNDDARNSPHTLEESSAPARVKKHHRLRCRIEVYTTRTKKEDEEGGGGGAEKKKKPPSRHLQPPPPHVKRSACFRDGQPDGACKQFDKKKKKIDIIPPSLSRAYSLGEEISPRNTYNTRGTFPFAHRSSPPTPLHISQRKNLDPDPPPGLIYAVHKRERDGRLCISVYI